MAGWHGFSRTTPPLFAPEGSASGTPSDDLIAPLLSRIGAYDPKADATIIEHAYQVAAAAHATQRRDNGDPYISHPVAVADILADYRLDTSSIATALLHDVIEDTGISLPELEAGFGAEIAGLVDGVTKLTRLELQSDRTKQAENFRKLVLAMSKDIRVLLVKLADRLHNMRTIHFVTERDRAVRIARETMEIYAPLAERIGMERVKVELQNRAFAVIDPEAFDSIQNRLNFLRGQGADVIEEVRADLMRVCREAGIDTIEILGREKSIFSIWEKMQRRNVAFEQLSDIMAFRIIVPTRDACYVALGAIHAAFPVIAGRFKDYISTPKSNLYRSLHTGVTLRQPRNQKIEVQIRTPEMHDIAENGVAAHWFYKQTGEKRSEPSSADLKQFRWVQDLLEILENSSAPDEFLENTKLELYQDQVFCFTPKGQLIQLPRGATPVDFAYAVHSQIGDRCVGARINGRLMPLRYALQNGDQVEILTARGGTPSASWERFVVTGKARARIRRFLAQQVRVQHRDQGKAALARAFRQDGVDGSEKILETILKPLKIASLDDLYVAVATGNLGAKDVVHAAYPALRENRGPRTVPGMLARPPRAAKPNTLPITGLISGMEIHYAGCCHPLPGDPIAGIIATGKGVTIHTKDCLTLETFANTPERFIDVDWDYAQLSQSREGPNSPGKDKPFTGRVSVIASHAPNALANLANAVAKQNASLESLKIVHRQQDFFECLMDIEVRDLRHLSQVIAGLRAAGGVTQVDRAKA